MTTRVAVVAKKKTKKQSAAAHLSNAEAAMDANDMLTASLAIARAWSVAPSDRIADLLERLETTRMMNSTEPFKDRTVTERESSWLSLALLHEPQDVARLMSLDWPVHPRGAKARFAELKQFAPDPRIVRSLVHLRKSGRYDSNAGTTFWRSVFQLLYKWKYSGVHEMFSDIQQDSMAFYRFSSLLAKPKIATPALDNDTLDRLNALEERLGVSQKQTHDHARRKQELLEAVYETPDDDAPRLVLADFLSEENDPRGEFIQLDIRLATEGKLPGKLLQRRNLLFRAAGRGWCEDIDLRLESIEMRRGFASRCLVNERFDPQPAAHRTLEWLALSIGYDQTTIDLPLHPNLVSVKTFTNVPTHFFSALLNRAGAVKERTFDHIGLADYGNDWTNWRRNLDDGDSSGGGAKGVKIRELVVPNLVVARRLLEEDVLHRTEVSSLVLEQEGIRNLPTLTTLFRKLPASIETIVMSRLNAGWHVRFERATAAKNDRGAWNVQARWLDKRAPKKDDLDDMLARAEKGVIANIAIL